MSEKMKVPGDREVKGLGKYVKASPRNKPPHKAPLMVNGKIVAMNEYGDGEIHTPHRIIKVARTVVGDQVRVQPADSDKRFIYGTLVKVLKPSDQRVVSECAAFEEGCGGCQWLHFNYVEQLRWKNKILRDILKQRCNSVFRINDILPMHRPYAYRNKLSLRNVQGHFANMQDFDDITVAPLNCRVETLPNQHARTILMPMPVPPEILQVHLRSSENGSLGMSLFVSRINSSVRDFVKAAAQHIDGLVGIGAQVKDRSELLWGKDHLQYCSAGLKYNIPLNGFFQTNYIQAGHLRDVVLKQLTILKTDAVLDLYCGCGFFTLPIAKHAGQVLGIENNPSSTASAAANATLNGLGNAQFETADVGRALRHLDSASWQLALLDPPRSGCDEAVIRELVRLSPRRIVYVSCSPSALARDLKQFLAASYTIHFCQPIDMFPHTAHIETVVTLKRK